MVVKSTSNKWPSMGLSFLPFMTSHLLYRYIIESSVKENERPQIKVKMTQKVFFEPMAMHKNIHKFCSNEIFSFFICCPGVSGI